MPTWNQKYTGETTGVFVYSEIPVSDKLNELLRFINKVRDKLTGFTEVKVGTRRKDPSFIINLF